MKQLLKSNDNMGGLIKMWAVPQNELFVTGSVVTLLFPDNIYEIYCTPESMSMKEPPVISDAGKHYKSEIAGFIPRDRQEIKIHLDEMEAQQFFIIFQDGNGSFKMMGHTFAALKCFVDTDSGKKTSDLAGCNITFKGLTRSRAIFIDNPFTIP